MARDKTVAENFFKRDGRLNRLRYFKRNLVVGLIAGVLMFVFGLIFSDSEGNLTNVGEYILLAVSLLVLVPSYCLMVRRLQDMDRNDLLAKVYISGCVGSYFLRYALNYEFMPLDIVLVIVALYILFVPGTHGTNHYGEDPLANA